MREPLTTVQARPSPRGAAGTAGRAPLLREAATAGDLCTRDVVVAPPSLSVDEAARLMRERHVGCVVVVEQGDGGRLPAGILTDRDIVTTVVARDMDPKSLRVGDLMSVDVAAVREHDTLYDVLATMRRRGVRRLPVLDAHGALAGVLSQDDVMSALAAQFQALAAVLVREQRQEAASRP
jgi:CBS domain-containing protein